MWCGHGENSNPKRAALPASLLRRLCVHNAETPLHGRGGTLRGLGGNRMNENTSQGRTDIWSFVIAGGVASMFALLAFGEKMQAWLV